MSITTNATLKAIALETGYDASWVKTASYTYYTSQLSSIAVVKTQSDNTIVACAGVVTACGLGGMMFIENQDRSCGIAVQSYYSSYGAVPIGTIVQVGGKVLTAATGERYISADVVSAVGSVNPVLTPLGTSTKSVGGGSMGLQQSMSGGSGLNNMGMLARTWGALTYNVSGCTLNDGGAAVAIGIPSMSGIALDPDWKYVQVTGNVRCAGSGGTLTGVIQPRGVSDVRGVPNKAWDVSFYPDFSADSVANPQTILPYGGAAYTTDSTMDGACRLRLTASTYNVVGNGVYANKVNTSLGLDTKFTFQISQLLLGGADGFGFVMSNDTADLDSNGVPHFDFNGSPINSVAVKFDTYQNAGEPSSNFVAIQEGGATYGITDGSADLTPLGINLKDGVAHMAEVIADPVNSLMSVKIDGIAVLTNIAVNYTQAACFDGNGQSWIGFAGRCGGCAEVHDIVNWRFRSALN